MRVLLVEDDYAVSQSIETMLKKEGMVVDATDLGEDGLDIAKLYDYDIIILDLMLPDMNGYEVLKNLRSAKVTTPVLILSGLSEPDKKVKGLGYGADDYLTKPLDAHVLEETVKSMLPQEKVFEAPAAGESDNATGGSEASDDEILEFPAGSGAEEEAGTKNGFADIEGLDYELALSYCAGEEELLKEIVADIAKEAPERAKRMRESLEAKDIKAYEIDAHTIKSSVLTIGLRELSARAKKHEFAAKDNDTDFIYEDADGFINPLLFSKVSSVIEVYERVESLSLYRSYAGMQELCVSEFIYIQVLLSKPTAFPSLSDKLESSVKIHLSYSFPFHLQFPFAIPIPHTA